MLSPKKLDVKICCISSQIEAEMAIRHGASAIGLVGPMPSGPGIINNNLICEIAKNIPSSIASFLLTSETESKSIISHHNKVQTNTIQLVDRVDKSAYNFIKEKIPSVKIVQVIHVINEKSIYEAQEVSQYVDAILLDSGNPNLKVKILGGTGTTHNWNLSRQIRDTIDIPVYLAGGLNAQNVKEAVNQVLPFGVDVCSGVRTNGLLDELKLKAFFEAIGNI